MGVPKAQRMIVARDEAGNQFLVRGDLVKFDLEGGGHQDVPNSWGLIHDPKGAVLNPCDIRIGPYTSTGREARIDDPILSRICRAYFGHGMKIYDGKLEIPEGQWDLVGRIEVVYYARYGRGNYDGLFRHPIKMQAPAVDLYKLRRGQGYRLQFPQGCIIDSHGFVWP
jgi:hypothetical protein